MNVRRALTENTGVKLIAFVVAAFIWFNASGQQQVVRMRTVPVVVEGLPDSLTITGPVAKSAEIRVSGTRRQLLTMGFQRVEVVIDLAGIAPGRQRIALGVGNVRVPSGFDRRNVVVMSPLAVDLVIERMITRRVPASLTTSGKIPDHLVAIGDGPEIEPAWITVRGPQSTLERIRTVPTRPFDLARVKSSEPRAVPLDFDPLLISCNPNAVTVRMNVAEKGQRVLANVPPTVLVDNEDMDAVVLPGAVSITVEGPATQVDSLTSGDVSVLLNMSGKKPAQYTMPPEVILPQGVQLVGISVDSLTVRLTRKKRGK